jgi:uracil phosphoribosyltransferase
MQTRSQYVMSLGLIGKVFAIVSLLCLLGVGMQAQEGQTSKKLEEIQSNRNNQQALAKLLPIVRCSFNPTTYELILMTQLRDKNTSVETTRMLTDKIAGLLVNKVVECLPTKSITVETPLTQCNGRTFAGNVDLVSIMRSGDALLETFLRHFPKANVNKFLIQRDEETAKPLFKYMKLSSTLASGNSVVIVEPMLATGGTLDMVISLLKDQGVKEENIIIASICTAPEGLVYLNERFPNIKVVMTAMDDKLNEKKYIVPGLGDFGDRFFGTVR